MKVIDHAEFEIGQASVFRLRVGIFAHAKAGLARFFGPFRHGHETDRLPARLLRDAGIDALEIERRRVANAPMIR